MLVYVLLRRHAGVAHYALRLTFFFPSRFAGNELLAFVVAVHERRFPGGLLVSEEICKIIIGRQLFAVLLKGQNLADGCG